MKMPQPLVVMCIAASSFLLAAAWAGASSPVTGAAPGETPPGVEAGKTLYRVQTRSDTLQAIAGTTPLEVLETRGAWVLVESNGIDFGPIWLNFDEVLHYKIKS